MSEPIQGALAAGTVFHGRYEIVRCMNVGGMGAIYECLHLTTRKRLALKVMLPQIVANREMRLRFELEARATANIESEHIVQTLDAGVDDATAAPFIVMEMLRGEELGKVLQRRGALPADETVLLLGQAALALDKTHAAGIVHRDLKPDNLFLTTRDDGSPRLKILDFGIAKVVTESAKTAQHTATIGTPLYMSPEQILGEGTIGAKADLYSLAHIAYTLLSGEPYWSREHREAGGVYAFLMKVMAGPQESPTVRALLSGVPLPTGFDAWFAKATARVAGERFATAAALVADLAAVLGVAGPRMSNPGGAPAGPRQPADSAAPVPVGSGPLGQTPVTLVIRDERSSDAALSEPMLAAASLTTAPGTTGPISREVTSPAPSRVPVAVLTFACAAVVACAAFFLWRSSASPALGRRATVATSPANVEPAPTATQLVPSAPASTSSAAPTVTLAESAASPPLSAPSTSTRLVRPAPARPPNCNPPYDIDAAGIRTRKPQCK